MMQKFFGPLIGVVAIGLAVYGLARPPAVAIGDDVPGLLGTVGENVVEEFSDTERESLVKLAPESLVKANGAKVDSKYLGDKDYILLYYSAHWCPPCRKFTPLLVDFYNKNHKDGNFEIVFISSDRNAEKMLGYMTSAKMSWVAVPFNDRRGPLAQAYAQKGIPNLVLIKPDGTVISASYVNGRYVGPRKVLADFKQILDENSKS